MNYRAYPLQMFYFFEYEAVAKRIQDIRLLQNFKFLDLYFFVLPSLVWELPQRFIL